ncbi:unnamed protein product [Linum trigynum]|uniref:Reverse transcriptase domain-containing protein n=1 Tax=Linum trigynum TaxID=586398 RepID=A0AAV2CGI4_9ROSI
MGGLIESFLPTRGLRQGCLLSPYLFTLCMERLSHIIKVVVQDGSWRPIRISTTGSKLSHSFFDDEPILFGKASLQQVATITRCLDEFGTASGQQVSKPKSRVFFSKNVSATIGESISNVLNIPKTKNLGRYLGVPVIHDRVSKATFVDLIDRVESRLSGWKVATLSLAGRITLAQSVLVSLPAYTMQISFLPASVREYIDKKIRAFICGISKAGRKIHLVDWDMICRPKEEGGLRAPQCHTNKRGVND